jgi:hypothetical protein
VRHRALLLTLISAAAFADADGGLAPPLQLSVRAVPATVKVLVTHLPAQRYELKTPSDLGDFDYVGQERQRKDGPTSSTTTIKVHLAGFALGAQKTPTLKLELTDGETATELELPGAEVEVVSSLPADAKTKGENLYDTRAPEELPIRTWRLLYALAALVGVGLVAWLIARRLSRPKGLREPVLPPPEPVEVRATKALDALAAQNLPGQGDFKAFYFRLSEIVRGYLGELYGFEALESTTPELLDLVRTRQTPGLAVKELAEFATESDFIRYARTEPTVEVCKQHLELAYRVVHETTVAVKALARAKALTAPSAKAPPPPEAP